MVSGFGGSSNWSDSSKCGVEVWRSGWYDPDLTPFDTSGSATEFPSYNGAFATSSGKYDRTCYRKFHFSSVSTPDPTTETGTSETFSIIEYGRGSSSAAVSSSDDYATTPNQWVPTFEDNSNLVSRSVSGTTVTWTWEGTYGEDQTWTQVATMTLSEEYTIDDCEADAVSLYNSMGIVDSPDFNNVFKSYDENGDPESISQLLLIDNDHNSVWADSEEADIPIIETGDFNGMQPVGSHYYETSDGDHTGTLESFMALIIHAGWFIMNNTATQPTIYTRTHGYDYVRDSATSDLYPWGSYTKFIQLSPAEVSALEDGQFTLKTMAPASYYTLPDPDFPVPT